MPTRRFAIAQLVFVMGVVLGWLFLALDRPLLARAGNLATVVHVAITGALAMLLVFLATWRDESRVRSLGLSRASTTLGGAIAFGMLGVAISYALSTIAVGLYFAVRWFVSTIPSAHASAFAGAIASATEHARSLAPLSGDPIVDRELAHKAEWAGQLAKIPLAWAVPVALFAGVYEEILFRGFALGRLRVIFTARALSPRTRDVLAIVTCSALFAAGHGYQGGLGLAQTFAAGVALSLLTVWRGSLWPAIVAHAFIDVFGLVALHVLHPILERLQHAQ